MSPVPQSFDEVKAYISELHDKNRAATVEMLRLALFQMERSK
jgi:hypothetical protein